jgi:hypothetical protein
MGTKKTQDPTEVRPDVLKVEDGRLIVDVALTQGVPSSSGKTLVFFSTRGNVAMNDGYVVGINLYSKRRT